MYDIPNLSEWVATIRGVSKGDKVEGDAGGVANIPIEQLVKRTNWLHANIGGGGGGITEVNDQAPISSTTQVWSINKLSQEFAFIDDTVLSTTKVWSSAHSKVANSLITWLTKSNNSNTSGWTEHTHGIFADTSGGAWTFTLNSSPTVGDTVIFSDLRGTWGTHNLTINGNGNNINGDGTLICDINNCHITLVYTGNSTVGWKIL